MGGPLISRSIRTATGVVIISMLAAVTVVFAAPGNAQPAPVLNLALTDGIMFVPAADGPTAAPGTFEFMLTDGSGHSIFTFSPYTCVVSETDSLGAAAVAIVPTRSPRPRRCCTSSRW
ncbi:MAG: hypothetical protein ACKOIA_00900 [Acidimicrobiia bacterium]